MSKIKNFNQYVKDSYTETDSDINETESNAFPLWDQLMEPLSSIWKKNNTQTHKKALPPLYLTNKHIIYLPYQQGPYGAYLIYKAAIGKGKLGVNSRSKLKGNVATYSDYYNIIKDINKTDKEVAIAFLKYYSDSWDKNEKEALKTVMLPKYKKVKYAIDNIKNPKFPKEFLYTVAYLESKFIEDLVHGSYKGLFQIGPLAWTELKKKLPKEFSGQIPMDSIKNAQAGHDYMSMAYEAFKKKIEIL